MNGTVIFIGANSITKDLLNETFEDCHLEYLGGHLHTLILNEQKYLLDIKEIRALQACFIIFGIISNDKNRVGNIALEFFPKSLDKSEKGD